MVWADSLPEQFNGVVVGNEVLDAMPVKLLFWTGQEWLERGVGLTPHDAAEAPAFIWLDKPAAPGSRPPSEYADSDFAPDTVVETHAPAEAFVATLAQRMGTGAAFFWTTASPRASSTCHNAVAAP